MFIKKYVNRQVCVIKHFDFIRRDLVNLSSLVSLVTAHTSINVVLVRARPSDHYPKALS